jgi:UDP-N-acetylglucosamine 2-epimerase (non-hydrolysing)
MKIMTVVGARPNFMKAAPIIEAIRQHNTRLMANDERVVRTSSSRSIDHILVHTGQHYGELMSASFFSDLCLPKPDAHLEVGSGSHASQTAEIMRKFEPVLLQEQPDVLILVGDVNSTVACALVAAKISYPGCEERPTIAHVEAGLRSFDRTMPEELNRILTDQLSDMLFVTECSGLRNLAAEGVPAQRVHFVGNTMIDSLRAFESKAAASSIIEELGLRDHASGLIKRYALLTLHRPANVDNAEAFLNILEGLRELASVSSIIFPAHPRTQKNVVSLGLERYFEVAPSPSESDNSRSVQDCGSIRIIRPLGYIDFLWLMKNSALVVTDSGGIQEETTCLGVPCVTVRDNTERPVTIEVGTNVLAGVTKEGILGAIRQQLGSRLTTRIPHKWDGKSAGRILDLILQEDGNRSSIKKKAFPNFATKLETSRT